MIFYIEALCHLPCYRPFWEDSLDCLNKERLRCCQARTKIPGEDTNHCCIHSQLHNEYYVLCHKMQHNRNLSDTLQKLHNLNECDSSFEISWGLFFNFRSCNWSEKYLVMLGRLLLTEILDYQLSKKCLLMNCDYYYFLNPVRRIDVAETQFAINSNNSYQIFLMTL